MKKFVLIAVAAIAFTTATQAQDSTSNMRQHPKMQRAQMFDELNLTADQKEKMKALREDNMQKMDAIKSNSSLSEDQKAEQMKTLRQGQKKSMDAILTEDQKAKMKQLRNERMKNHNGMSADSTMRR